MVDTNVNITDEKTSVKANVKALKITNPLFLGQIAPMIQDYFTRIFKNKGVRGVSYESLHAYLTSVVQFGRDRAELWVAFDGDSKPLAFAMWKIPSAPYFGIANCDHMFNSNGNKRSMEMLVEEFIKFGREHNTPYYTFKSVNQKTGSHFVKIARKHKLNFETTGMEGFIGRVEP